MYHNQNYLIHHGVKGMKWGVRRYQNEDGSLTDAGKKKVSREYSKQSRKTMSDLSKKYNRMYIDSYNKAANHMNNGGIDKFNKQQEKKYGADYAKRSSYTQEYQKTFEKKVAKYMDRSLYDFYQSNKHYKKSKELVDKYKMIEWDDLAKQNTEAIEELRLALNK